MTEIRGIIREGSEPVYVQAAKLPDDGLKSIDFITLVDILSEGQIEGSATASRLGVTNQTVARYKNSFLKDLFLNGQPVLKASANENNPVPADKNYTSVTFQFQDGTANNAILDGRGTFDELESSDTGFGEIGQFVDFPQGAQNATERSASISQTDTDRVKVRVEFEALRTIRDDGNIEPTSVNLQIKIHPNNSSTPIIAIVDTVTGKSQSTYSRDYGITLNNITGYNTNTSGASGSFFPISVILTRTNDEGDGSTSNRMKLAGVTRIINEPQNYPHVAYSSLRFSAEEFPSLPSRVLRIRGKKVRTPAAQSPVTAEYTISGNTVTIQKTNHGLIVGDHIFFNAIQGSGVDGAYFLTSIAADGNSFEFVDADYSGGTVSTSNCTYRPNPQIDRETGRMKYPNTFIFNGNLKNNRKWTSDPAWILYDLLVTNSERTSEQQYGCDLPDSAIDIQNFYAISRYCSELVDDGTGNGTFEPRFSLNVNIRTQREALELINDICNVMRAVPFYGEGSIKISQDAPKDITDPDKLEFEYVFNNANVVDGEFVYSGSSIKTRSNVINVSYLDLETQEIDYVTEKDSDLIAKYGAIVKTIKTFGTTSRGQAHRVAKWYLNTQKNSTETCVFETNIAAGAMLHVGNIIGIADRVKGGSRRGGVVKSATQTAVTIDDATQTDLPVTSNISSNKPTITCMMTTGLAETKLIAQNGISNNVITLKSGESFSSAPVANSPFVIEEENFKATSWKIINIKETEKRTYVINAVKHHQAKYNEVEGTSSSNLPTRVDTNVLFRALDPPNIATVEEKIVVINNRAVPKIFIDWPTVDKASSYILQYRRGDTNGNKDNYTSVSTQQSHFEIVQTDFTAGTFDLRIFPVNGAGRLSEPYETNDIPLAGFSVPPEQPQDLELEPINNYQVRLSWKQAVAQDVVFGGRCVIRHTGKDLANAKFSDSIDLDSSNGNTTEIVVPALAGTYTMKFEDLGKKLSTTEAKVQFTLPETIDELLIKQIRENSSFGGTLGSNLEVDAGNLQLKVDNNTNTLVALSGTYAFFNELDLLHAYQNVRLKRVIQSEGFNISNVFDDVTDVDLLTSFDGDGSDRLKAKLQVATSNGTTSFSNFLSLTNGSFVGRSFKFRSTLESLDVNENIKFSVLGVDVSLPSRLETKRLDSNGNVLTTIISSGTSSSGLDITFANRFYVGINNTIQGLNNVLPSISIAPINMPQGGYFVIKQDGSGNMLNAANQNINGVGFNIIFYNASNQPISVKFTFQALGYGKGV